MYCVLRPDIMADKNDNYHLNHFSEDIALQKWKEKLFKKFVKELKTEDRFVNFFKGYSSSSVESFIDSYAKKKVLWMEIGENRKKWTASTRDRWMDEASKCLELIQYKKLFNAQCLWLADQVKLQGISIYFDFGYWQERILDCPSVAPVTSQEIDLMIQFLKETPYDIKYDDGAYDGDASDFGKAYKKGETLENYSPWFQYYDNEFGTYNLLGLPNIREEKDLYYMRIGNKIRVENLAKERGEKEKPEPAHTVDNKPILKTYLDDFTHKFVKANESPQFYRLYLEKRRADNRYYRNEQVLEYLDELKEAPDSLIMIEPADDWREAVANTFEHFRRQRVIDLLPAAFRMYKKERRIGLEDPSLQNTSDISDELDVEFFKIMRVNALLGRKSLGEPENFDY